MSFLLESTREMVKYAKEREKKARGDIRKADAIQDREIGRVMREKALKDGFVARSIVAALEPMLKGRKRC